MFLPVLALHCLLMSIRYELVNSVFGKLMLLILVVVVVSFVVRNKQTCSIKTVRIELSCYVTQNEMNT